MALVRLCRDCGAEPPEVARRCAQCGSTRLVAHPELGALAIAHIDCDAFYASIEKRDDPTLADKPVIVGGGKRGVVAACCYVARLSGVRSAMPMFKALRLCPDAVVIPPDMAKYKAAGREVRRLMEETTPLVQPLSIDEAFLDLTGTDILHKGPPARTLGLLARRIEREVGVTVSIGLSYNKFLAKIASDLDKPRGFAVIGRAEAESFLAPRPVGLLWGVGAALQRRLAADGITTIGQLRAYREQELVGRYGSIGRRLYRFARGEDDRRVDPDAPTKSISSETTFAQDTGDGALIEAELRPLCAKVAQRLVAAGLAGTTVTLKLKTADFRIRTRAHRLDRPTQRAEVLLETALLLLARELDGTRFRLVGIGADGLVPGREADPPGLFDQQLGLGSASISSSRALIVKSL
ncbi:MAG: DNA polymerase IV [Rhodospirillales bacterium]|nr:DNA polymerase IV [Rhodospirillales bacterium]